MINIYNTGQILDDNANNIDNANEASIIALDNHIYIETITLSWHLAYQACSSCPNLKDMSLIAQYLERTNIDKDFKVSASDSYSEFCELFFHNDHKDENFATEFNVAIKTLQKNMFSNPYIVLIIFSNFADIMLIKNFQSYWIISDKINATSEPELIMSIIYNIKSVEKIIGVGDVKQLMPVVLSCCQS